MTRVGNPPDEEFDHCGNRDGGRDPYDDLDLMAEKREEQQKQYAERADSPPRGGEAE
ncbi:hypothetical protein ACN6LF_004667 [[Kitasatospora] papulosa]|uniref:hypothetical protein n=1 Tax=[Kitasatospora] papulosa TaxID=1464011 RepID=UPI00403D370B